MRETIQAMTLVSNLAIAFLGTLMMAAFLTSPRVSTWHSSDVAMFALGWGVIAINSILSTLYIGNDK